MPETTSCRGYGERADCDQDVPDHLLEGGLCPKCRLLQKRADEQHHRATRDPQVEPW